MHKRVVVTGMGLVTSLGSTTSKVWQALLSGQSGITLFKNDPILRNKDNEYYLGIIRDFDYLKWKVPHASSRMNSFLHCAAQEALQDSKIQLTEQVKDQMGISVGTMSSNTTKLTEFVEEAAHGGYQKINRLSMMHILSNIPTATLSIKYGTKGPTLSLSTACATGLSSIGEAYKWIKYGEAKNALAGGVEDVYNPTCLYSSIRLQAMSTKKYDSPAQSSRPFDADRSGFILGEGSGILHLEQLEFALSRGAKIYAEILGYCTTSDGYHLTRPQSSGNGVYRSMEGALKQGGISPSMVDSINCHATSTPVGDEAQAEAISKLFQGNPVILSAFKSNFGHTFGAAGAIETALALVGMQHNIIPRVLNLNKPVSQKLLIPKENTNKTIKYLLKNALGFGGINVSVLFKKWQ